MFALRAATLAILVATVLGLAGPGVVPVMAGADVCPEPNGDLPSACFLGPGGPAPGFIDSADDVDGYRIELPADSMIVATLSSLPADYSLRLLRGDASVAAEASQPGLADKVVRADGLPAGTYYLAVFSQRGESNPDAPYFISVAYPASLVLNPTAPGAPAGAPQGAYGYIPGPAKNYGLIPSDLPGRFLQVARDESEDGTGFAQLLVAPDAFVAPEVTPAVAVSRSTMGSVDTLIYILPYGSNDELAAGYNKALDTWRSRGWNVEPAAGWGSEQVYSFAQATAGVTIRGIALKHRNAIVLMTISGYDQFATWDAISNLMRKVEQRIHAAAQ